MAYYGLETEIGLTNGSAWGSYEMMQNVTKTAVLALSSRQPFNRPRA